MATVIAFPKRELSSHAHRPINSSGSATIVMFTGVRRERLEDGPTQQRPSQRRLFTTNAQATAENLED